MIIQLAIVNEEILDFKMSSSKNNNLPIQTLTTISNTGDFASPRQGSALAINTQRSQRVSQDQANSSHRGRSGKSNRGRERQAGHSNRTDIAKKTAERAPQSTTTNLENSDYGASSPTQTSSGSNNTAGKVIGYKPSSSRGGGGGKYRQRHQTNQLLGGMSNLDGLDVEFAETIIPTSSSGRGADPGKGRHLANSRKMNLTHLLNYKYERPQRKGRYQQSPSSTDSNSGSYHRNNFSHYRNPGTIHKFSKQQFLQANCQFVVLNGHDYTVHKVDPDWPVDWDCIEEVRFKQSSSTETTCPICLEFPVAAKITRCGHIYCWTCMLHYLSLSDENCRQCPICFEPVYKDDLRSVVSQSYINHSIDEEITMKLMVRKKGCVEVEPYKPESQANPPTEKLQPDIDSDRYWSQANLVIVDALTVISNIAKRERSELLVKLHVDRDEPEVCFIQQALIWLDKRVDKLRQKNSIHNVREAYESQFSPSDSYSDAKCYLFYQCSDGQHIYLNPFSTKILCHEFNNLENCPQEIQAKILQMDWISMNEAWRKRFRYLEHLPLTCEFRLIEIDFANSKLISERTHRAFEDQIKKREQERERRRREERKREKIIQVEQNRRIYGIQPSLKINLDSIDQFPSVSDERYLGLSLPRNQFSARDGDSTDSEGLEEVAAQNVATTPQDCNKSETNTATKIDPLTEQISDVTFSFNEIQIQEAVRVAAESSKQNSKPCAWSGQKQTSAGAQSSFAQLLVDAKSSQKEWTRNVSSTAGSTSCSSALPVSDHKSRTYHTSGSDDGGEELRAPPGEFTISDFIDMNIVSSSSKRKGKLKSAPRKG